MKNPEPKDNIDRLTDTRPLIIIGRTGTLGAAFSKVCRNRNIPHILLGREEADISDETMLSLMINRYNPWVIVNTAGYVKIDEAETCTDICYKTNSFGAENLAMLCKKHSVKLVSFSSDMVFNGRKEVPYIETDETNPINIYGHSKEMAEKSILCLLPDALIIRTAAFFGPWDQFNFVHRLLAELNKGKEFVAADDVTISPTYIPHLVDATLDLLIDDASGIWHLTNRGCLTWYEFADKIVSHTSLNRLLVIPAYRMDNLAHRPRNSALSSMKYGLMPTLDEGVQAYFSNSIYKTFTIKTQ